MNKKLPVPERTTRYRVLIVDDHPVFRQGLKQLINLEPDLVVCGEAEDRKEALAEISTRKPDLALVDVSLRNSDGIELVKDIYAHYPWVPVLVLSMHDEVLYADRALRAGAHGYIMKQETVDKVIAALRHVINGNIYLSEAMQSRLLQRAAKSETSKTTPLAVLSDRELQVFRLLGRGKSTSDVAQELHIGVATVETHRAGIKRKLKLRNATELLQYATRWAERSS